MNQTITFTLPDILDCSFREEGSQQVCYWRGLFGFCGKKDPVPNVRTGAYENLIHKLKDLADESAIPVDNPAELHPWTALEMLRDNIKPLPGDGNTLSDSILAYLRSCIAKTIMQLKQSN